MRPFCRLLTTLAGLFILTLSSFAADQTADSSAIKFGTDDGPHVFWQDDTTIQVIYFCDSAISTRQFAAKDTIRFIGFCKDSAATYRIPVGPRLPLPDQFDQVSRMFAVSDIHGEYQHLIEILTTSKVIDSNLTWSFGNGHLVIVGDVFDRGPNVTECLWLIYRLEQEASAAGGKVHFLLGNHELMIMRGDLRYVNERYAEGIARRSRFKYDELFGPETELGRWLRSKNTILRLGGTLFVHGGLLPEFLQDNTDIGDINQLVRKGQDLSSMKLYFDTSAKRLYGMFGPFWYRGYTEGIEGSYPAAPTATVDSVLNLCKVDQIVVGHTEHDTLSLFHDGKVIAIDVDVETLQGLQGLLWEASRFYRVNDLGERQVIMRTKQ
jgi:hypothetical protein